MKILVISNCPLDPNQGSGYVICGFSQGFQSRGHHVQAFGPDDFILIPNLKFAKRLRLFLGYTLKSLKEVYLKNNNFDIIELWGGVGWLSCLLLKMFNTGGYIIVSRSNGLEPHCRLKTLITDSIFSWSSLCALFNNFTDKLGFQFADLLTVVSKYDEVFALNYSCQERSRILLLENALNDDWLNQETVSKHNFVVGFVGSWNDRKGNKCLVDIINTLDSQVPSVKWIVAGVGVEGKKQLLNLTNLPDTSIYEDIPRQALKLFYHEISVLLCLSSYESFGMACSEAMSCGCILLSTKVGFAFGLSNGIDYIEICRDNVKDIVDKLLSIEANPSCYMPIRNSGYKKTQQLRWNLNIDILEARYSNLLVRGKRR